MKLPELKRRFKNKYVIRIAAGVLTIAVAGGSAGVYTVNAAKTSTKAETTQESTDKKDKKDNKDDEEDLKEVLSSKISKAADEEVGKEETVYVVADNSGKAKDVIVSDWLKNPDGRHRPAEHKPASLCLQAEPGGGRWRQAAGHGRRQGA